MLSALQMIPGTDAMMGAAARWEKRFEDSPALRYAVLAFLLLLGIGIRIYWSAGVQLLQRDEILYVKIAEQWFESGPLAVYHDQGGTTFPPLFSWLMTILMRLGLSAAQAGRGVSLSADAVMLLATFGIARQVFRSWLWAFCALGCMVVSPQAVRLAMAILRDPLGGAFFGCFLYLFLRLLEYPSSVFFWAASAVTGALATQCRLENLEILMIMTVYCCWRFRQQGTRWETVLRAAAWMATYGLTLFVMLLMMDIPLQIWLRSYLERCESWLK